MAAVERAADRTASVDSDVKVIEAKEYEGVNLDMAQVMADNEPDPFGPGYKRLYAMVACLFLCSTMNGAYQSMLPLESPATDPVPRL